MAELKNRDKLEAEFARRLARVFARHRREFVALLGDPPDAANVPPEFWERAEKETREETLALLLLIYSSSMIQHGFVGDIADVSANKWATTRAGDLARQTTQTTRDWMRDISARWNAPTPATNPDGTKTTEVVPPTKRQVSEDTTSVFGPQRVENIAVTETSRAQYDGAESAIDGLGIDVKTRYWRHTSFRPRGHAGATVQPCKICTPMLDRPESEWNGLVPGLCHPRCDCWAEIVTTDGEKIG